MVWFSRKAELRPSYCFLTKNLGAEVWSHRVIGEDLFTGFREVIANPSLAQKIDKGMTVELESPKGNITTSLL